MFTSKDLKKLIIPLIFEQLLAVSVGFVDTFMVSIAGEGAVSGVALVDNISNPAYSDIISSRNRRCCCMQPVSWQQEY